mgnify:CR=1 FL=1
MNLLSENRMECFFLSGFFVEMYTQKFSFNIKSLRQVIVANIIETCFLKTY